MIRRIVTLWMKDCSEQALDAATRRLHTALLGTPGLLSLEIARELGLAEDACTLSANLLFDGRPSFDAYLNSERLSETDRWLQTLCERIHIHNFHIDGPARRMPRLYAFIGPSNRDAETLSALLDAGMNGIRLSLAHHDVDECLPIVEALQTAAARKGVAIEVLVDRIAGPGLSQAMRRLGATGVILDPVASDSLLKDLRRLIHPARILCRIEHEEDLTAISRSLDSIDELVIAREGMLRSQSVCALPLAQKRVAAIARGRAKPFMLASDLLRSMRTSLMPTAAELCDIHEAVCQGASALMLTREVAQGRFPVEAMRMLHRTAEAALNA